jgi:hypothetical protein
VGDHVRIRLSADTFEQLQAISRRNDYGVSSTASLLLEATVLGVAIDLEKLPTLFEIRRRAGLVMKTGVRS